MPRAAKTLAFFTKTLVFFPLSLLLFSFSMLLLAPVGVVAAEKSIVVFGDSVSAAYGLAQARGWVALLGQRLKRERLDYIVVNASISGETSAGGLARIDKVLAQHKPAIVVLELGGNDSLRGLSIAQMTKNLAAIIERSQKAGARVLLVGVRIPPNYGLEYSEAFAAAYPDLAKRYKTAVVPFVMEDFWDKPELFQADRIHPAEAAQPMMEERVWKALRPLLKRS
jgi:acyl-CoA thioesterase-1